jgi:hypothetical protein
MVYQNIKWLKQQLYSGSGHDLRRFLKSVYDGLFLRFP